MVKFLGTIERAKHHDVTRKIC